MVVIGSSPLAERLAGYLAAAGRLAARCDDTVGKAVAQRIGAPDAPAIVLALGSGPALPRSTAAAKPTRTRAISWVMRAATATTSIVCSSTGN